MKKKKSFLIFFKQQKKKKQTTIHPSNRLEDKIPKTVTLGYTVKKEGYLMKYSDGVLLKCFLRKWFQIVFVENKGYLIYIKKNNTQLKPSEIFYLTKARIEDFPHMKSFQKTHNIFVTPSVESKEYNTGSLIIAFENENDKEEWKELLTQYSNSYVGLEN